MKDEEKTIQKDQDLKARTKAFALRIIRLYGSLSKTTEAQVLGKQVLRSGTSVGAHYREAPGRNLTPISSTRWKAACKNLTKQVTGLNYWLSLVLSCLKNLNHLSKKTMS